MVEMFVSNSWVCLGLCFLMATGCAPKERYAFYANSENIIWTGASIDKLARMSRKTGKQLYFSDDQVVAMIGKKPELILKVGNLPELLDKDSNGDPQYRERIMQDDVYRSYTLALEERGERPNLDRWESSERFENLDVWLYNYRKPSETVVGGLISTKTGIFQTEFFLIEGRRVLCQGWLQRTFDHEN